MSEIGSRYAETLAVLELSANASTSGLVWAAVSLHGKHDQVRIIREGYLAVAVDHSSGGYINLEPMHEPCGGSPSLCPLVWQIRTAGEQARADKASEIH